MFDFAVNHTYNDNWYIVTQIVHVISPLQLISAKKSALYVRELGQHFADDICKCIFAWDWKYFGSKFHWSFFFFMTAWVTIGWSTVHQPLPEPIMTYFIDAYMRQQVSMS